MLLEFCMTFWNVFAMMAPWLIAGFFIAGTIAVCMPRDFVTGFLGSSGGVKSIIRAVLAFLMVNARIRMPKMAKG